MLLSAVRRVATHTLVRQTTPVIVSMAVLSHQTPSKCGWFGGSSSKEEDEQKEALRHQEEQVAQLRAKLGPLASLDLNGDGKIDAEDAMLALTLAKEKAAAAADVAARAESVDEALKVMGSQVSDLIATGVPSKISWGFCSGYCAGFAAKKVGKAVAVAVGSLFCLLQALHYNGYITVDHAKIEQDFNQAFDINHDGSLDQQDLKAIYDKFYQVVSFNVPSGSGFAAGLLLGLRSG